MDRQFPIKRSPPDERDYRLTALMVGEVLNEEKVNSNFCGPIYDQGTSGFCWAFAATAYLNWLYNKHRVNSQHHLSPLFVAQAVKSSTYSDYPQQEGESIRAAIKGVQKAGSVAEIKYPYGGYGGRLSFPSVDAFLQTISQRFRVGPYAAVDTLDEITTSLSLGNPVLAGVLWTDRYLQGYQLDFPFGTVIGGHAILLLDNYPNKVLFGRKGWIKFQNSWGEDWGESGFGWISHDYLRHVDQQLGFGFLLDGYSALYVENGIPPYEIEMQIDNHTIVADDVIYITDTAPKIGSDNRTYLPVRSLTEVVGYDVQWEPLQKRIELRKK